LITLKTLEESGKVLCQGTTLVTLFCKGAITVLCQLYNSLWEQEFVQRKKKEEPASLDND
jgi:hypothetical protein